MKQILNKLLFLLYRVHPNNFACMEREREQAKKRSAPEDDEHHAPQQGSVSQYFRGGPRSQSQENFNKLVLHFVIQGLHPLWTVERPEYIELFREILPSRELVLRRTLGRLLDDQYSLVKSTLVKILSKQNHVCTTTDAWSSNNRSFLGVTIH